MSQAFSQLLTELRQNTRLRMGILAILVILLSYIGIWLKDYNAKLQQEYREAVTQLNRLQAVANQKQWTRRASKAQRLRNQLEAQLWQAETKGLAQAAFQKWINAQLTKIKIEGRIILKVKPAVDVKLINNLWQVTADLSATVEAHKILALIAAVAKHPQLTVIERLNINKVRKHTRFNLLITAYFKSK
jgi:hypothetical protein